jgi:hypothetical protein
LNYENTADLCEEVKFENLDFSEFPIEVLLKGLFWEFYKILMINLGPIPCMPLENILIPCIPLAPHVIDTKKYTYMPLSGTQGMSIKYDGIPGIFSSIFLTTLYSLFNVL